MSFLTRVIRAPNRFLMTPPPAPCCASAIKWASFC